MLNAEFWLELAKYWGPAIAVLGAWYYHNREQNKLWGQMLENNKAQSAEMIKINADQAKEALESNKVQTAETMRMITAQANQTLENNNKIWSNVFDMYRQQQTQQNEVLKQMLETSQYQGAQLSRMEQKIDTNQFCPLVKKEQNK